MAIGQAVRMFEDENRSDPYSRNVNRSIAVSVYYPINNVSGNGGAKKYLDLFAPAEETVLTMLSEMGVDSQHLQQLGTRVLLNEEPYNGSARPIILYSPAFGVVKDMYSYNIQPLVESGFVVVALGSTYESIITVFPDGTAFKQSEQVGSLESADFEGWYGLKETRVKDLLYVLDRLQLLHDNDPVLRGIFDLQSIGVIGHSLGGAAVLEAARRDQRIQAGVMLDPSFHLMCLEEEGALQTPFLVVRQEKTTFEQLEGVMSPAILEPFLAGVEQLKRVLERNMQIVSIRGADHMTFCDVPLHFNEVQIDEKHTRINSYVCSYMIERLRP